MRGSVFNRSLWDRGTVLARSKSTSNHAGSYSASSLKANTNISLSMAYHEMRLMAAKVYYNFDLELCPESNNWADQQTYILWEKKPLMCKLRAVN